MDEMNNEEKKAFEETKEWMEKNDSIEEIRKVLDEAKETVERLKKSRKVRIETLLTPIKTY